MGDSESDESNSSGSDSESTTLMWVCPHYPEGIDYEEAPLTQSSVRIAESVHGWTCFYCIFTTDESPWDSVEQAGLLADQAYYMGATYGHDGTPLRTRRHRELPFGDTIADHFMRGVHLYNEKEHGRKLQGEVDDLTRKLEERIDDCKRRRESLAGCDEPAAKRERHE